MPVQSNPPTGFSSFTAGENDNGRRFDRVLKKMLPEIPASLLYKSLRTGHIKLNGKKLPPETKVTIGDIIWIHTVVLAAKNTDQQTSATSIATTDAFVAAKNLTPITLCTTDDLLFINKPYGIAVHGGENIPQQATLDYFVKEAFAASSAASASLSFTPGPLHRIDRNTTGLVVFSRTLFGAVQFSQLLKSHQLSKQYLGIVEGCPTNGCWQDETIRNSSTEKSECVQSGGKETRTDVTVLGSNGKCALVLFSIHTGRTHQIRLQCGSRKFPLMGDVKYGGQPRKAEPRYFLHSWKLSFPNASFLQSADIPTIHDATVTAPLSRSFKAEIERQFGHSLLASLGESDL